MTEKENGSIKKLQLIYIAAIAMLILAVIYLIFDKREAQQQIVIIEEQLDSTKYIRDSLTTELTRLAVEYDVIMENNTGMTAELAKERAKIEEMIKELTNVKNASAASITKYKSQIASMQTVMQSYVRQVDSLNTVNRELNEENAQIRTDYEQVINSKQKLQSQNELLENKVKAASSLNATNIIAGGLKKNGKPSPKIKKMEKIGISFNLDQNKITTAGTKTIYIRITRPDDYILSVNETDLFEYNGKSIGYSAKREINYTGEDTFVELFYNKDDKIIPGIYFVDVYCEGFKIGSQQFELK